MYSVVFPNDACKRRFERFFSKLAAKTKKKIEGKITKLAVTPRPSGIPKIIPPVSIGEYVAQHRIRIGDYRVLYDVDDKRKKVYILAIRKRGEKTYK